MNEIKIAHLEKSIVQGTHKKTILSNITLTIPKGEFFCIMGTSGSGKSTLLRILGGMDRATAGEIYFFGKPISQFNEKDFEHHRREVIGYVFQSSNLLEGLSVKENVILPLSIQGDDLATIETKYRQMMKYIDLSSFENNLSDTISGGEMQRAAICRALIKAPQVILADEPTGSLDRINTASFLHIVRALNEQLHTTVLLVTHDPFVAGFCNQVAFLENGQIRTVLKRSDHPTHFQTKIIESFIETRCDSNDR